MYSEETDYDKKYINKLRETFDAYLLYFFSFHFKPFTNTLKKCFPESYSTNFKMQLLSIQL